MLLYQIFTFWRITEKFVIRKTQVLINLVSKFIRKSRNIPVTQFYWFVSISYLIFQSATVPCSFPFLSRYPFVFSLLLVWISLTNWKFEFEMKIIIISRSNKNTGNSYIHIWYIYIYASHIHIHIYEADRWHFFGGLFEMIVACKKCILFITPIIVEVLYNFCYIIIIYYIIIIIQFHYL